MNAFSTHLCRCGHIRANHSFQGCTAEATVSGGIPGISGVPRQPYALGVGSTCMCRKFTD